MATSRRAAATATRAATIASATATPAASTTAASDRRYYIDFLRVLATVLLIYFHTARVFDYEPWAVRNGQLSLGVEVFKEFVGIWHMPLFFLLAGSSVYLALRRRTGREFVGERVRRLFIPLVAGILLVIPPQVYFERIGAAVTRQSPISFSGSFLDFYPHFFQGIYPEGNLSWAHLWFVAYLFLISLALLPLLLWLRDRRRGRACLAGVTHFVSRGANLFWLALPLVVIELALRPFFPGPQNIVNDLASIVHYATLVVLGFMLVSDSQAEEAARRHTWVALAVAALLTVAIAAILIPSPEIGWARPYSVGWVGIATLWNLAQWFWLVAIIGLGKRYLNRTGPLLRHAAEIAYPFYIFHQTVIIAIAFYVVRWPLGIGPKYFIISTAALVVSVLLCELVKLTNFTRFIFGMRPKPSPRLSAAPATARR